MRASAAVEKANVPSVSLVCAGFIGQGAAVAKGLGLPELPIARIPGHVDGQSASELASGLREVTLPGVIEHLTRMPGGTTNEPERSPGDIVITGDFDTVNDYFDQHRWSDGLPIVPPSPERVAAFLAQTTDPPERIIGALPPSGCAATVHNVAVNGVMANCRPEYMPVLIAIAEVLAAPHYGVEHSGDTTGGDALIVVSGPAVSALGFNCEEGALRDGYRANTSIGRFLRLMLRNEGELPASFQNLTSLRKVYVNDEHLKVVRDYYCRQRIPQVGKYNWIIVREMYPEMAAAYCENPPDTLFTFNPLQVSGVSQG